MARTPTGRKTLRYTAVSVISVVVTLVTYLVIYGVLRLTTPDWCQVIATAVGTVPSYTLNRYWAWGMRGRSQWLREVVPFWVLAFVGLAFSVYAVDLASVVGRHLRFSHTAGTVLDEVFALASYGILWVGKFIIFNRFLFVDREEPGSGSRGGDGLPPGAKGAEVGSSVPDQIAGLSGGAA